MSAPLYSIVIPTFNRAHLIEQTLESVFNQTYTNWECIIVDDGSTDNTSNLLKSYVQKDARFSYFTRPLYVPSGGNGSRNFGLAQSKGNLVIFLDSDDLLKTDCIESRNKCLLTANYDFDMLVSHTASFNKEIGDSDLLWNYIVPHDSNINILKRYMNLDMPWCTNGVTWSKPFLNKIGTWNENLISWQDWELHSRAMFYNPTILYNTKHADNYFRKDTAHVSIGTEHKSKVYLKSIETAIKSVSKLMLRLNTAERSVLKPYLLNITHKMLIAFPIENGKKYAPIRIAFNLIGVKMVNAANFAWVYIVLTFGKSSKLKKYFFRKDYPSIQNRLVLRSTYLKIKESSISKGPDIVL